MEKYAIGHILGSSAVPLHILVLLNLLVLIALVGLFFHLKIQEKSNAREIKGRQKFYAMMQKSNFSASMMLRKGDLYPVYVSDQFEQTFHIKREQLRTDFDNILTLLGADKRKFLKEYKEWNHKKPLDVRYGVTDGRSIRIYVEDMQEYLLITLQDESAYAAELAELNRKLLDAEDASDSKTSFLSRMSHEIRTPMNGIIGMLMLIRNNLANGKNIEEFLDKADDLSQHMLSLLNDILDMSRIEAGKIELENNPFSLHELGDKLESMFRKTVEEKGVRFDVIYEDIDEDIVIGDELRLSQIMVNFLSNAQKFTAQGEITATIKQLAKTQGRVNLMMRVHDTGIGMQASFINRIFHPFEQESIETGKKYGGTGLGMAITDRLIKLMGGEIFVESIPGQGSDFTIYLELPIADSQTAAQMGEKKQNISEQTAYTLEGLRILMAEDNEINAEVAVEILQDVEGATVEVAENGQIAVDMYNSHEAGYYDVILLDIQMPVMDGRTAARTIRGLPRPDATEIPIFALSADAFVEDERLSVAAGMNGHFKKPIEYEQLRTEIGRFIHEQEKKNKKTT